MATLIKDEKPDVILAQDMKNGDVAVVVEWGNCDMYVGTLVQRLDTRLVMPFQPSAFDSDIYDGWSDFFDLDKKSERDYRVRLLPPGSEITIRLP